VIRFITNVTGTSAVRELLQGTKKSIEIISPWITAQTFMELVPKEIFTKIKDGTINSRAILRMHSEFDAEITDAHIFGFFKKGFSAVRIHPKVHSKILVIDREVALVSSMNWTPGGFASERSHAPKERDSGILSDDPEVLDGIQEHFQKVWLESTPMQLDKPSFVVLKRIRGKKSVVVVLDPGFVDQTEFQIQVDDRNYSGKVLETFELPAQMDLRLPKDGQYFVHNAYKVAIGVQKHLSKKNAVTAALVTMEGDTWRNGDVV